MKHALLFLALAACGGAAQAAKRTAFQIRCEDTISKSISVLSSTSNGYTINNRVPVRALGAMKPGRARNSYVLGVTRTESRMSMSSKGSMLSDRASGYECVAPQIDVKLYYAPIVIYVGSEFQPGTCAYREVLAHEMRHLKTYLDHLPKVEAKVRRALSERFDNKPLYAPAGRAQALLRREMDTGWLPYIKNQMAQVEVQQRAIDTPQEYARLSKICKGEVQSIIRTARANTR